jgi:hypothetical protein
VEVLHEVISDLIRAQPEAALELLASHAGDNPGLERRVLTDYAFADPVAALPAIEEYAHRTGDRTPIYEALKKWMPENPQAAGEYFAQLSAEEKPLAYREIISRFMRKRPREALLWISSLGEEYAVQSEWSFRLLGAENTALAASMLPEIQDPQARYQIYSAVARERAQTDPEAALAWINEQLPNGVERAAANAIVVGIWAGQDLQAAARFAEARADQAESSDLLASVATQMASENRQMALSWLLQLPESQGKNKAVSELIRRSGSEDPSAALTLYKEMPAGRSQDQAAIVLYNVLVHQEGRNPQQVIAELAMSEDALAVIAMYQEK